MKHIKKIIGATMLAALMGCQSGQTKKDEKPSFKPSALVDVGAHVGACSTGQVNHTLRTQGMLYPIQNGSLGLFLEETTAKELPLDSASSYFQLRPNYDVLSTAYGKIGVMAMAELSPGFTDRARLGFSVTPSIDGLFTQLRVFPLKSGEPGFRADSFSSASILDGILSADLLLSYRKGYRCDGENQLSVEPMVRFDIGKATKCKPLNGLYVGGVGKCGYNFKSDRGNAQFQAEIGYRVKLP